MAFQKYMIVLVTVGIVDAISYMLVTPSLIFYVLQNGGSLKQYGIIMSSFSFSSFCTKPFLGWWSDKGGFRLPYMTSISIAMAGGVAYLLASGLPKGNLAVNAILLGRLLGGCGAASNALGYAYVAQSVPPSKQTSTNALLSLCRMLGMAIGPGFNVLLDKVDIPITDNWGLDNLNSVGILLVVANLISALVIYFLLEEPTAPSNEESVGSKDALGGDGISSDSSSSSSSSSKMDAFLSCLSMDMLIPMLTIFTFNANFQLMDTAFAPAANDALGWGVVESSYALGSLTILIGANMVAVMKLSKRGIADSTLLCGGAIGSIIASLALYFMWTRDATIWGFYFPVLLGCSSFPYMMATARSIFTVAVKKKPALQQYQGFLQTVLSMAASVAGFTTPGLVAAYVLRSPEEVLASTNLRELTPWGLVGPGLFLLVLLGMVYLRVTGVVSNTKEADDSESTDEEISHHESPSESSSLLPRPKEAQHV